jgi:hypothetical protein
MGSIRELSIEKSVLARHLYLSLPDSIELLEDEDNNPGRKCGSANPALIIIRTNRYQTKKKSQKKFF